MFTPIRSTLSPRLTAVLQALFVTFLWSTSWVFIKIGLQEIPPLLFAGLRFTLAAAVLLTIAFSTKRLTPLKQLSAKSWSWLTLLGILFVTLTQGSQFLGLAYLPAVSVNLLLGFSPVAVALLGILFLQERPSAQQWLGIALTVSGALIYFYPPQFADAALIGLAAAIVGVLTNASSAILGRYLNRAHILPAMLLTLVSMSIGALVLLLIGILVHGFPTLHLQSWLIILWLAVVNTAFAFTLWNHTLRSLTAMESSIINNTMAIQIPLLAVFVLGERLSGQQLVALIIAIVGTFLVQLNLSRFFGRWRKL